MYGKEELLYFDLKKSVCQVADEWKLMNKKYEEHQKKFTIIIILDRYFSLF